MMEPDTHLLAQVFNAKWLRRLDSLRVKLFLAIAGANMLLVIVAYLVYSWSFDRGMVDYLNRAYDARLAPLVRGLATNYQTQGSWQWYVDDPDALGKLLHESLGLSAEDRGSEVSDELGPGHHRKPAWVEGRLFLLNAEREVLTGSPKNITEAWLTPIQVHGQVVGYLGRMPRYDLVESLDQVVSARQGSQFAVISLALLLAVALNAALISDWLARRLSALGASATAIANGDYSVRLPQHGHDELAHLAAEFNHMARSIDAAQQARKRWIADIAHELRTPLSSLRAEIEALLDGVREPTPFRLESLAQEVTRLTRLVEDLRQLSMADIGALDYTTEPLDLGMLVADYLEEASAKLPQGWLLQKFIGPGIELRADSDRLCQVLSNLYQNSLRYTDSPGTLRVRLSIQGMEACLVWEDSAPGVPPESLPRLTERLYRVDMSRARTSGGTGLGLSISHAIVVGHGGRMMACASELGGLRWNIYFPCIEKAAHG